MGSCVQVLDPRTQVPGPCLQNPGLDKFYEVLCLWQVLRSVLQLLQSMTEIISVTVIAKCVNYDKVRGKNSAALRLGLFMVF